MRFAFVAGSALLLMAVASSLNGQQPLVQSRGLAITHVSVIDTQTGALQRDVTLLVRGDRIASIASSTPPPRDALQYDGRGKFALAGFWDMHVHLSWASATALPVFIANGVTGVRDLRSNLGELDEWRTRIEIGDLVGPRIVRAGPMLNGSGSN